MRSLRSTISVVSVGVVCVGCKVSQAAKTTASHTAAASVAQAAASVVPATNRTVLITATDFAYTGLPSRVPAGWVTLRMANAGRELHMFATADVPRGYTVAALLDSMVHGRYPSNVREWGGPNAVAPGDTTTVSLFLPAGAYVVGCFVTSADGKEHFDKGMMGSFTVVPAPDTGAPPAHDGLVTLSTYHIAMTDAPVRPGPRTLLVRNVAREGHDFVILKVLPGHTVADALRWFANPAAGTPTALPIGGTTALHTGEHAFVNATFTPGTYVLVCWMTTNSKFHFQLGMKKVFTIPET